MNQQQRLPLAMHPEAETDSVHHHLHDAPPPARTPGSTAGSGPAGRAARRAGWALLVALLLAGAAEARAHLGLVRTEPAAGARLDTVPEQLRLVFTQPVELAFSRVRLLGPAGEVQLAPAARAADDPRVLTARIAGALAAGEHRVEWQVAGPDGHPIRGQFTFAVAPGAEGLPAEPAAPAPPAPPPPVEPRATLHAQSPAFAAARALGFAGLLATIGAVAFRLLVLGRAGRDALGAEASRAAVRGAAGLGVAAAGLLMAGLALRLYAQWLALARPALRPVLFGSTWGTGWTVQAAGALLALTGLLLARAGRTGGWALATAGALVGAFAAPLTGHPASSHDPALAVIADGAHVLGAGGWLGSLLALVLVGVPAALRHARERPEAVAGLVGAFSPVALGFAALVVVTGVLAGWRYVGGWAPLWQSEYGQTLLLKLAALAVVFAAGAWNWRRVRPGLAGGTVGALRRTAAVELLAGVVVVVITAVLVATPPPAEPGSLAPPSTYSP